MFTDSPSKISKLTPSSNWEPQAKVNSSRKSRQLVIPSQSETAANRPICSCYPLPTAVLSTWQPRLASSGCTLQTVEEWPPAKHCLPTSQVGRQKSAQNMENVWATRSSLSAWHPSASPSIFSGCRHLESLLLRDLISNCQYSLKGKQSLLLRVTSSNFFPLQVWTSHLQENWSTLLCPLTHVVL